MNDTNRVLGIDPGSVTTGWGVVDAVGRDVTYVAHGHIRAGNGVFNDRLTLIHRELLSVIVRWRPTSVSLEGVFVGNNPQGALKLGQARGVAVLAATLSGLEVKEYAPRTIKQAVSGNGNASKEELQKVVRLILSIKEPIQMDAGDGLAIAICHAHSRELTVSMPAAPRRRRKGKGRGLRC